MIEKLESIEKQGMSRRELLVGASKVAAGAAIVGAGGMGFASKVEAGGKINVDKAGKIAYENYHKVFCAQTVVKGLVDASGMKGLDPSTTFWAHGGIVGWGTACGSLIGAGIFIGQAVKDPKKAQLLINEVMAYYANTVFPVYSPKKAINAEITAATKAGTPLCHISVGRWMKEANTKFFTAGRKERCARVSADIAMEAARQVNAFNAGKFKQVQGINAKTFGITAQENCSDCHGGTPGLPG